MGSIMNLVKEEGRSSMSPELAAIRSDIATGTSKAVENGQILKDVMGATWAIDTNLREDIKTKNTLQFGHCPNLGGGLPLPEFF